MPKILIVDDEPNVRWTLSEFLNRAGHEAITASDFGSAIKLLDNTNVDLAVIDIILPNRNGIELLKEIHSRDPYMPVIMMTADPDLSHIPDIVREGAYDFMPKPVVKVALINAVSRAIEKKRLVDEKRRLEQQIKQYALQLEKLVAERTSELAEAHNFLNTVLDSSTEYAIIAIDIEERVSLFNRGAELMFGCSAAERLCRPLRPLIVDERYPSEKCPLVSLVQD